MMRIHKQQLAAVIAGTAVLLFLATLGVSMAQTAAPPVPQTPIQQIPVQQTSVQHGATLFHESGCEHCHGADGRGTDRGPDLGMVGKRLKKLQIEHQIHDGGGGMPSFAEALQPDDITALVEFLATKKKLPKGAAPYHPAPTPVPAP